MSDNSVLFVLLLLASVALSSFADRAVWIAGESGIHPDHPGKCWSQSQNRELNIGDQFTDKSKCELIRCGPNLRFTKRVCSNRSPQAGCVKIEPDASKEYPGCCAMVQCAPVKIDY